jgi:prepilin-type N-terminal cleavage/methylation domain-containing protein
VRVRNLLRRLARGESGYSLIELVMVMIVLGIVLTGLTTVFVSATRAEFNANQRFQNQQAARLGLDYLRDEVHCASAIAAGYSSSSVTLTLPAGCPTGNPSSSTQVTWCTVNVSTNRYALYRQVGTSCGSASGTLKADYLTSGSAFTYTCTSGSGLFPVLSVSLPVNVDPTHARTYTLGQDIAFRNAARC